jgi:hypothetical protein
VSVVQWMDVIFLVSFQCIVGLEEPEDGCFKTLIAMLIFVQC